MKSLNIATWNILSDKGGYYNTESQAERKESIIHTLASQEARFDVVGLLEVEDNEGSGHHGKHVAQAIAGVDGHWVPASIAAEAENIGVFGKEITGVSSYNLTGNRAIVLTQLGDITIALIHFTYGVRGDGLRTKQAKETLEYVDVSDNVILAGDFNSASRQRSRKVIEKAGFQSVFHALGRKRPRTIVAEKYRKRLPLKYRVATKRGFSPDDIYVKGLKVLDAGVFEGDSDHLGVWAQIETYD